MNAVQHFKNSLDSTSFAAEFEIACSEDTIDELSKEQLAAIVGELLTYLDFTDVVSTVVLPDGSQQTIMLNQDGVFIGAHTS